MIINQDVDPKQPLEVTRYVGDWRPRLLARAPGETISQSVWAVLSPDSVLTTSGAAISSDGLQTSALFSGGTAGAVYIVRNTVTLSDGQIWVGYGLLRVEAEATLLAS